MSEIVNPDKLLHPLEISQTPEKIITNARWENFTSKKHPLAGAIVHWGVDIGNLSIAQLLTKYGHPTDEESVDRTGFTNRSLYPLGFSLRDAAVVEEILGAELIRRSCENRGIKPENLSGIAVACSFPYYPGANIRSFAKQITALSGVPKETPYMDGQLLCNTVVELMRQFALRSEELDGKYVALVSVEGLGKMFTRNQIGDRIHPANYQIFTNAGAAVVWEMGRDIKFPQIGEFQHGPDEYRAIVGDSLFDFPEGTEPGGIYSDETYIRQRIIPTDGSYASMDPAATLQWVAKVIKPRFLQALGQHFPDPQTEEIPFIGHVPSEVIHANLIKSAERKGYNLHAPIYVRDGNASSAVFPMQLLRAGADGFFKGGQETFVLGYGLGWNASSLTMRVLNRVHSI